MADYVTLLSRAVASLAQNTRAAREALYSRARTVLVDQLRAADPPLSEAQIEAEAASLETAIGQIEVEIRRPAGRGGRPPNETPPPRPPRRPIAVAEAGDADAAPVRQRPRGVFSPAVVGVVGAIVLAGVAAGTYAYLSRPTLKPPAPAALNGGGTPAKPITPPPVKPKKTVAQHEPPGGSPATLPYVLRRQLVYYRSTYPPGTIIVVKSQHMLYEVRAETVALRYSIAIGPKCLDAAGLHRVMGKETSPVWPPANGEHRADSRLGARILYLSDIDYGIHGTDKPSAIGQNFSFGCFLLADDDIDDLYDRTPVDTRVVIMN